jgi:hypothetical protein
MHAETHSTIAGLSKKLVNHFGANCLLFLMELSYACVRSARHTHSLAANCRTRALTKLWR